ncbi:MAG: Fe-S cluster assembly ATPase SufC [Candidatus Gracilibacteria bacterium]|nr:Fe-S cluster assembly ATPase SufC [Candidatus Gracilibacteria bacterium]MDD2909212.1 Fe-S cluster assembly ATPase SufC [Candidatus Gracilibacteria bacterium]
MLKISNISVEIDSKKIVDNISMSFNLGQTYFLLGKNGSGKSSLAFTIAGHPKYKISSGEITVEGENIIQLSPDKRNKLGIFLSFQNVPEIKGIRLSEYLRTIYNASLQTKNPDTKPVSPFLFKRFIGQFLTELSIPENFLDRDLNVGFSGGEKRKIELLQIKLLNPKYIILDEIDSGLDIDAFKIVASNLAKIKNENNTLIFITHNFNLLDYIEVDGVFVLEKGELIDSGDQKLVEKIKKFGYCSYCNEHEDNCDLETKCT